jgi:hypothetical protein
MNGCFKMGVTKAKEELQTFRFRKIMKPQFLPTDVIPIVNKAWECSFARNSRGKKALAERGGIHATDHSCATRMFLPPKPRWMRSSQMRNNPLAAMT